MSRDEILEKGLVFEYKFFLLCNHLANSVQMRINYQNFAELIYEEEEKGRLFNKQMTQYFHAIEGVLSDVVGNDPLWFTDHLDFSDLKDIDPEQLKQDYNFYVVEGQFLQMDFDSTY